MKLGSVIRIKNAKDQVFNAILMQDVYEKDMSEHYGNKKGEIVIEFVKVRRFIKSRNEYAATETEYPVDSVVSE